MVANELTQTQTKIYNICSDLHMHLYFHINMSIVYAVCVLEGVNSSLIT